MIRLLIGTLARVGINGFLLSILGAIFLAYLVPDFGSSASQVPWKILTDLGIALVFFFYGVKLNPEQLKTGLSNWKLHVLIQACTFLFFPIIVIVLMQFAPWIEGDFQKGISFLSVLPSTVSASVVMVSIAGGNLPAAIFNASISSLIGVLITPIWMGWILEGSSIEMDFWVSFGELSLKVLLPVLLGLFFHQILFSKIEKYLSKLKYLDQTVILMIVFTSFAQSFSQEIFTPYSIFSLLKVGISMLGLFFMIWGLLEGLARIFGFEREDRITALFCGSKKSLVQGVVIGKIIFPDPAIFGLVLLPVMLYHIQQLIVGSILAGIFSKRSKKKA
jgi:solute carrier family 10 (sodium/bile acid cotransporter), member 7